MMITSDGTYTDKEYQHALKQLYRSMERQRISLEAQVLKARLEGLKKTFDIGSQFLASHIKDDIQSISSNMDKSIKGAIRTELEAGIKDKLKQYDHFV
ncbi:hypothetical protein [Streptococcus oricebi]|uniref:Uncharacterized protein n=1 Tax=Streptococcus oricebi TaxID=1547447 RepID=A0ABS5B665_9STRE|nr:hypothetical protein [Streptococcus oricebi]MBP2624299.1 hypothetical protein [Streptococcus oricebi]